VFVAASTLAGAYAFSRWRLRVEERAWAAAGLPFDALRQRWPAADHSAGARTLDELARPLGVRLIPGAGDEGQNESGPLFTALNKAMGDLATQDGACDQLPPEAVRFLDAHRAEVSAVAAHLRSGAGITWRIDLEAGYMAPVPALLAQRHLGTLLVAEALERSRRGDAAGADQMLEAAGQQADALDGRPDLISGLIAVSLFGLQEAALRCLPEPSPAWEARLEQRLQRSPLVDRLRAEAYGALSLVRQNRGVADLDDFGTFDRAPGARVFRLLTAPYVRLCVAGMSRHTRRARELGMATDRCRISSEQTEQAVVGGIPRWDFLSRVAVPGLARASWTGTAADLETEMTRLVLQTRRRAGTGAPAPGAPTGVPSTACTGVTWRQDGLPGGRWIVHAVPPPAAIPWHAGKKAWEYTFATSHP